MQNASETMLRVDGMTCGSCARHVDEAHRGVDGVSAVEVRVRERLVLVKHAASAALGALVGALRESGYESTPVAR